MTRFYVCTALLNCSECWCQWFSTESSDVDRGMLGILSLTTKNSSILKSYKWGWGWYCPLARLPELSAIRDLMLMPKIMIILIVV